MIRHIHLRVHALSNLAEDILGIELVPLRAGVELPPFTPGAHIDLHLPTESRDTVRSYSLTNAHTERHRYCVAVQREAQGDGGSQWVHEHLKPGQTLRVSAPRNHFELDRSDAPLVLVAGGIGITPLLAMVRALASAPVRRSWTLHYAVRHARKLAFVDTLQMLADASAGTLHLHIDEQAGKVLDIASVLAQAPSAAHLYACGPTPLLQVFEQEAAAAGWPSQQIHLEYFGSRAGAQQQGSFIVKLLRSARQIDVRAGQTILEAVLAEGVDARYSCRSGFCGSCEVKVISGQPEHLDQILSDEVKAAGDRMLICCSRSRSAVLELDL